MNSMPDRININDPKNWRDRFRQGEVRTTVGLAKGFVQANLVILPKHVALDFLIYCQRNPLPFPVLEVLEPGVAQLRKMAPGADLRTDLPKYRIYEKGKFIGEVDNLENIWSNNMVSFLMGSSPSLDHLLLEAEIPVRHLEEGQFGSLFITDIETEPAGIFNGPIMVSFRPIPGHKVAKAVQITSRFPALHGRPIHIGDPAVIGIKDLKKPDYGTALTMNKGEVPVFWACGSTSNVIAQQNQVDLMITHAPSHMLITDVQSNALAIC